LKIDRQQGHAGGNCNRADGAISLHQRLDIRPSASEPQA
jgi:hypothetical protein